MEVVSWKCDICLSEFPEKDGAACSRCNGVFCDKHFMTVREKNSKEKFTVCTNCIRDDDEVEDLFFKIKRSCNIFKKNE